MNSAELVELESLCESQVDLLLGLIRNFLTEPETIGICTRNPIAYIAAHKFGSIIVPLDANDPRMPLFISSVMPKLIISDNKALKFPVKTIYIDPITCPIFKLKPFQIPDQSATSHIYFTSGSTGVPKACQCTFNQLMTFCEARKSVYSTMKTSRFLVCSPHTFDPFIADLYTCIIADCVAVVLDYSYTISNISSILLEYDITDVWCTPSLWTSVEKSVFPRLETVCLGGEPMPKEIASRWKDQVKLYNVYGTTECTVYQTYCRIKDTDHVNILGNSFRGAEISLKHEELGMKYSPKHGDIAQVVIGGSCVGSYLKSSLKFVDSENGMLFLSGDYVMVKETSDLDLMTIPGFMLEYFGRSDTQIKIAGKRIDTNEIVNAIISTTDQIIQSCAVVFNISLKIIVAYVIPSEKKFFVDSAQKSLLVDFIYQRIEDEIPPFMIPSRIQVVFHFPVTPSGKTDSRSLSLQDPYLFDKVIFDRDDVIPWCRCISRIYKEILALNFDVAYDCTFSQIGGDSIKSIEACSIISRLIPYEFGNSAESTDQKFGQALILKPGQLLKRQQVYDLACYLQDTYGPPNSSENQIDSIVKLPQSGFELACIHGVVPLLYFDVKHKRRTPNNAIHLAIQNLQIDALNYLLSVSFSIYTKNIQGATAIHVAAQYSTLEVFCLLLKHANKKIDVFSIRDVNDQVALHYAARYNFSSNVNLYIIERTKSINEMDKWGRTALHWACVNGNRAAVISLLENNCDSSIKDFDGETAVDICERRARCGETDRGEGIRASVFGDLAKLVGGSGSTKKVSKYK